MRWLKSGGFLRFLAVFRSFLGVFLMFGMLFFFCCAWRNCGLGRAVMVLFAVLGVRCGVFFFGYCVVGKGVCSVLGWVYRCFC